MKNLILFSILLFVVSSCGDKTSSSDRGSKAAGRSVDYDKKEKFTFNNPALMAGSDFLGLFRSHQANNNFDTLVLFTSKESIDRLGVDFVYDLYKNKVNFNFEAGKMRTSTKQKNGNLLLSYPDAVIVAEKTNIQLEVVIENDTCKLVLPKDLDGFLRGGSWGNQLRE